MFQIKRKQKKSTTSFPLFKKVFEEFFHFCNKVDKKMLCTRVLLCKKIQFLKDGIKNLKNNDFKYKFLFSQRKFETQFFLGFMNLFWKNQIHWRLYLNEEPQIWKHHNMKWAWLSPSNLLVFAPILFSSKKKKRIEKVQNRKNFMDMRKRILLLSSLEKKKFFSPFYGFALLFTRKAHSKKKMKRIDPRPQHTVVWTWTQGKISSNVFDSAPFSKNDEMGLQKKRDLSSQRKKRSKTQKFLVVIFNCFTNISTS